MKKKKLKIKDIINMFFEDSNDNILHKADKESINKYLKIRMAILNNKSVKISGKRTKNCLDDNLIAGYYDNKLSERLKNKVEKHLSKCDYCLNKLIELNNIIISEQQMKKHRLPYNIKKIMKKFKLKKKNKIYLKIKRDTKGFIVEKTNIKKFVVSPKPVLVRKINFRGELVKSFMFAMGQKAYNSLKVYITKSRTSADIGFKIKFPRNPMENPAEIEVYLDNELIKTDKIFVTKSKEYMCMLEKQAKYKIRVIHNDNEYSIDLSIV